MKRKYTSLPYTEYPVADGHFDTNRAPIEMIVLHSSASTKQGLINTFGGGTRMVSAHYGIDNDGTILAFLEEYNTAYHAGNLTVNRKSIGIEHIDNGATVKLHTDQQYEMSIKLVKDICDFYKIPIDDAHIVPHSSITATACPNGLDVQRIIKGAQGTPVFDQDKKDIESMKALRQYSPVWYEAKDIIKEYEDRKKEIEELQKALSGKNEVISKQGQRLITLGEELNGAIERAEKAESEAKTKEELRLKWYTALQKANEDIKFIRGQRDMCYTNLKKEQDKNFDLSKATKKDLVTELFKRIVG